MTTEQFTNILVQALAAFEQRMNVRFNQIDNRFDKQEAGFNSFASAVGERFTAIDKRLATVEGRLTNIETKFDTKDSSSSVLGKLSKHSGKFRWTQQ